MRVVSGSSPLEGERMKQLLKAAALVAAITAFSSVGFAQCKIVVVDMQEAVTGSNEGKDKAAKFDARVKEWTDKLDKIKADLEANQKRLQAQQSLATPSALATLNKNITDKQTELTRTSEDAQKDVDSYRDELLGPVMETAQKTLQEVAAEKAYSIVYDLSAPNSPIVYSSKDCNVTEEIKNRLNAKAGTAAKPATTTAPKPPAATQSPAPAGRGGTTPPAATAPAPAK
jgi:outer membrane protein